MHTVRRALQSIYDATDTRSVVPRVRLFLQRMDQEYNETKIAARKKLLENDLRELVVLSGPFKGLRYPASKSLNSSFFPKLLGTYEKELHEIIERVLQTNPYETIVDVGTAEGYYAAGFAMRCPNARIYAYDIDAASESSVESLASANGLAGRIDFGSECTGSTLVELTSRFSLGLLISDCEGYEIDLLRPETMASLHNWDLLIETHDFLEKRHITRTIKQRASATHHVSVIRRQPRAARDFPMENGLSGVVRQALMDEGRTSRSRWLFCESLARNR